MTDIERDALLQSIDRKIDEMREHNAKVKAVLFDANGHKGLCSQVEGICDKVEEHSSNINRLWIAVIVLAGGAGSAIGVPKLIQLLAGG